MQTQLFLKELQRLQQRQQDEERLRQQLQIASLMNNLPTLSGSGGIEALLLREILQNQQQAALGASPTGLGGLLARTNTINPQAMSNAELLRAVESARAAGMLEGLTTTNQSHVQPGSAPPTPATTAVTSVETLPTSETNKRKHQAARPVATPQAKVSVEGRNPKKQKRAGNEEEELRTCATEASSVKKTQKKAAQTKTSRPQSKANDFMLPPLQDNEIVPKRMPRFTSFKMAWATIKSKEMQKEIFLRKLHAGKMVVPPLKKGPLRKRKAGPFI